MIDKVKNAIKGNKLVLENFSFLFILRLIEMGSPIIVYPYLIKTVGAHFYGKYVFAFSVMQYLVYIINFGFNSQITKEISVYRHNKKALASIISAVITIKIYIFFFVMMAFFVYLYFFVQTFSEKVLYFMLLGYPLNALFFPLFYFRGVEKLRGVSIVDMVSKFIVICLLFFTIKRQSDYLYIGGVFSVGMIIPIFYAFYVIVIKTKLRLFIVPLKNLKVYFTNSIPFFLASFSGILKDRSAFIIIGKLFSMEIVAYFDLAYKVTNLSYNLLSNLSAAFFPKVVRIKDNIFKKKLIILQFVLGLLAYLSLVIFGPFIVKILGGSKLPDAYSLLVIVSFILPLYLTSNSFDLFYIIPSGRYKIITKALFIALISYSLFLLFGLLFKKSVEIVIFSLVLSALCEMFYRGFMVKRILKNE